MNGSFCLTVALQEMRTAGGILEVVFVCKFFGNILRTVVTDQQFWYSMHTYFENTDFIPEITALDVVVVDYSC